VDLILSSGDQARELMRTVRDVAARFSAISSMDVYRAWACSTASSPDLGAVAPEGGFSAPHDAPALSG